MDTLTAHLLIDLLDLTKTSDPWKASLNHLAKHQAIDPYKIETLIAPFKASPPAARELLTAACFLSLSETLKYEMKGDIIALCDGIDSATRDLIFTLLGHSVHKESSIKAFNAKNLLYFGVMAMIQNSQENKNIFLQKMGEMRLLLDRNGNPFLGMLSDERDFCLATQLSVFHLLFSLAYHISAESSFKVVADHLYHRLGLLEGYYLDAIPADLLMLSLLIKLQERSEICSAQSPKANNFYRNEALLQKSLNHLDFICRFAGERKSFGALHKGNVEVVAMAPHKLPLGVMENFGFYRLLAEKGENFSDLQYEEGKLSGWIKLCAAASDLPEPGLDWLHMEVETKPDYLTLNISPYKEVQDLYFVFFIKAKEAKVEGRAGLKPKSLERIQSKISEIFFKDADELLSIRTSEKLKIEVIPLAGGNHFWSAYYLVAFPIDRAISIEIS